VLERIRSLCVSARGHRQDVERFLASFTGGRRTDRTPQPPRVLIVDDAQDVRDMLAIALAAAGLEPLTAADGLEALLAAHVARPEAIQMDINMPGLNGIEAPRLLRASASTRAVAVLAQTATPHLLAPPIAQTFDSS
jgi:PleD family two-component response regulator